VLSRVRSSGQQQKVAKQLDDADVDQSDLDDLSPEQQGAVGPTVARGGDDATGALRADGGGDIYRLHNYDFGDVDTEKLISNIYAQSSRTDFDPGEVAQNLERLKQNDIDGVNSLAREIAGGDTSGFRGHAYEAEIAADLERRSGQAVDRVGTDVSSNAGSTELDVQLQDGSTIEVKAGDLESSSRNKGQIQRQLGYRNENNLGGDHYVAVKGDIEPEMKTYLEDNNVKIFDESSLSE
jgi:hypothetical protein